MMMRRETSELYLSYILNPVPVKCIVRTPCQYPVDLVTVPISHIKGAVDKACRCDLKLSVFLSLPRHLAQMINIPPRKPPSLAFGMLTALLVTPNCMAMVIRLETL